MDSINLVEKVFTEEEQKEILKERAKILSAPLEDLEDVTSIIEFTEFTLGHEKYGIETKYIREVHSLKSCIPLPCTTEFVFGIINIRGKIVSVINVKKFFDLPDKEISDLSKVIIIHNDIMEFGIYVDGVTCVRQIPSRSIYPELPTMTDIRVEYLLGVLDEQIVLLDGDKLLSDQRLVVHEEV